MRSFPIWAIAAILLSTTAFSSEQVVCDVQEFQGSSKATPKGCGRLSTTVQVSLPGFVYSQACRVRVGAKVEEARTIVMLEQLEGPEARPTIRRAQIGFPHTTALADRFELTLANNEKIGAPAESQRHYTAQCRFK